MAKRPKDAPEIGDRVQLRGSHMQGVLQQVNVENDWASVKWDVRGPVICHLFELKKLDAVRSEG